MLSAAQFSRGMNNAERVLANGDILQAKSAIFVRELKPGMVKDINPRAHRAVKYAAEADRPFQSARLFERMSKFLSFDDVHIERLTTIGGHHVVERVIAVADENGIPCPDGERFRNELIIELVHREFAGWNRRRESVQAGSLQSHDGFRQKTILRILDVIARESPWPFRIGDVFDEAFNRPSFGGRYPRRRHSNGKKC